MLLGFDIGGTKSAVCIGDSEGKVLDRRGFATDTTAQAESVLHSLIAAAKEIAKSHAMRIA